MTKYVFYKQKQQNKQENNHTVKIRFYSLPLPLVVPEHFCPKWLKLFFCILILTKTNFNDNYVLVV